MTVTVLLDLDDTLLENEMGRFLPSYFSLITNSLGSLLPQEKMLPLFLNASQKMLEEQRMDQPLLDIFFDHFLPGTGLSLDSILEPISKFYADVYPVLQAETKPVPDAQALVREFAARGYRLVVATNPLFPETAVLQRVEWAGLPVPISRFDLVTANEAFHFSKPDPAYYAEVLGYMGWPEGPVLMIGNDPLNDVQGASRLGLPTYLVSAQDDSEPQSSSPRHGRGTIADAAMWLDSQDAEALLPDFRSPDAVQAVYRSTVAIVDTLLRRTADSDWQLSLPGEWTPHQVLHHLKDVEERVNLPRVRAFLSEENPFISGVDTDAWYRDGFPELADLRETFDQFLALRRETLQLLASLDSDGWQLPARHAIFGPTDLLEISFIMARHDQLHVRQLVDFFRESEPAADEAGGRKI